MREVLIVIFMSVTAVFAQDFAPLSRSERRAFVNAADAIVKAVEDGNHQGVMRFAPGILARYESILLDPRSADLRPLYEQVERLLTDVAAAQAVDTFLVDIRRFAARSDYFSALAKYDDFFDYLTGIGQGSDSLISAHQLIYRGYIQQVFDGEFETLQRFSTLRHADRLLKDSLFQVVEGSYRELFMNASMSNNIADLFAFREQYPGLFEQDIANMINSYRMRWRLSLRRRPSLEKIDEYYMVFPEKDRMVDSLHQKLLYDTYKKNPDITSAMKYLSHFPAGRHAQEIRTFIEVQQEQQRLAQLLMLQEYRHQNEEIDYEDHYEE